MSTLKRYLSDEGGATAIEYGLIAGLIFLAIVAAVTNFASGVHTMYNNIASNMR